MTQLLIAGIEVVLPQDFSVSIRRENSFFTKNGQYTYDCTLHLNNRVNATLYGFLNRMNKQEALTLKRPAVLIADGHVYCRGTEVISSWTDKTVTIQIVSGNSELNYFIGQSLMVSFLSGPTGMGSIEGPIYAPFVGGNAANDPKYTPPDDQGEGGLDYCMPTIYDPTTDTYYNQYVHRLRNDHTMDPIPRLCYADLSQLRACPYLCAVVRRLMKALGYTVGINHIDQPGSPLRYLFFVNTVDTRNYCEMFPGWSVGDLLSEIELLTNCHFVVDNSTRRVDIINTSAYYQGTPQLTLQNVIDAYEAQTEDSIQEYSTANLVYDLPDNEYSRFDSLSENVSYQKSTVEGWANVQTAIGNLTVLSTIVVGDSSNDNRAFIKRAELTMENRGVERLQSESIFDQLIPLSELFENGTLSWRSASPHFGVFLDVPEDEAMQNRPGNPSNSTVGRTLKELIEVVPTIRGIEGHAPGIREVDMLRSLKRTNANGELRLGITPCHFALLPYWVEMWDTDLQLLYGSYMTVSTIVAPTQGAETTNDLSETTFEDSIKAGASANDAEKAHLYVAFYNGYHPHRWGYLPTAYTDAWHAVNMEKFYQNMLDDPHLFDNPFEHSLRLKYLDENLFGGAYTIDTEHPFTFETYDPNILDPRAVIVVRNKRFVVRDIEETINAHGRSNKWKVTCYPFDISDQALGVQWVLTTGLWDDHAVWLDDGRWNDGE